MRSSVFFAVYTVWSTVWVMVAITYGWSSYVTWRREAGRWRDVPREFALTLRWFFFGLAGDIRGGRDRYPFAPHYSHGHCLRLFVTMSALVSAVLGSGTALIDRSGWSPQLVAMTLTGISLSTLAACGHLSLAWSHHARRYRLFLATLLFLWAPFGALILVPIIKGG